MSYEYEPIRSGQLRLCRFLEDGDELSATLETFSLDEPLPHYRALSYTWSTDVDVVTKKWSMRLADHEFPMLDSLRPFVQTLRTKGALLDGTWWWIDSICIDQGNSEERSQQVRRMKHIYQFAGDVVVWLGERSDDSDSAIDFIYFLNKMRQTYPKDTELRKALETGQSHEQWIALKNFFRRKWWTRIWTVQEYVVPRCVTFWCGTRSIDRTTVFVSLCSADRYGYYAFKPDTAFFLAWNRARAWRLHEAMHEVGDEFNPSLLALAAYFCANEASDDRDRLYGLTALSNARHPITTNYLLTVDEVYTQFAHSFITKHGSLDILSFASLFSAVPESSLPSWVPDWRRKVTPHVIPLMVSQSSNALIGNFRPVAAINSFSKLARYSASGNTLPICEFHNNILTTSGIVLDEIDGLAGGRYFDPVQSTSNLSQPLHQSLNESVLLSICRSLVLNRCDRYLRYEMPSTEYFEDFLQLSLLALKDLPQVRSEFKTWFRGAQCLTILGHSITDILSEGLRTLERHMQPDRVPEQDEQLHTSFFGRFFDAEAMLLRLMTSRSGLIGMAPGKSQKGDLICVLFGCSVPIILRKTGRKEEFVVIGECYVDGHMEGEALHMDQPTRDFSII